MAYKGFHFRNITHAATMIPGCSLPDSRASLAYISIICLTRYDIGCCVAVS